MLTTKMNNMFKIILTLLLLIPAVGYAQVTTLGLSEKKPTYELIVDVEVSSAVYEKHPSSDDEAGYRYRLILTRSRIFEALFLEKQILNAEGGVTSTKWSKTVDMLELMDRFGISPEQMVLKDPQWMDKNTFIINLSEKTLQMKMINEEILKISE